MRDERREREISEDNGRFVLTRVFKQENEGRHRTWRRGNMDKLEKSRKKEELEKERCQ